ncbi:MAG: hypothetical protein OXO48_06545 [Caldilineaceae bacterium]|nr:hypothetical protein [Caldilineaceae bacterium]
MINSRPITAGPKHHWFGYYDKLQFDPSAHYALGMEVGFEHRPPTPEDKVRVGMVDLCDGDRWIELGESRAWGWQAGCMLQWLPRSDGEVIWNDREGGRFVSHVLNVRTGQRRTLPHPVFTLSPDGVSALTIDFHRLEDMRPGYGYMGIRDPWHDTMAPHETGIHGLDLRTGGSELIVSLAEVAAIPYPHGDISEAKHYFNVLIFNPSGSHFLFLHRWRFGGGGFHTRMLTAAADGSDLKVVDHSGHTSHLIWRDDGHILAWSRRPSHGDAFYLFPNAADGSCGPDRVVGKERMPLNGHCTYLSNNNWVLNDTYPQGDERLQDLYLYHVPSDRRVDLGRFHAPPAYTDTLRCDLHPRSSPDGSKIAIDSAHGGNGRQMYLFEVGKVVAE